MKYSFQVIEISNLDANNPPIAFEGGFQECMEFVAKQTGNTHYVILC